MVLVDKLYGTSAGAYINFFGIPIPEMAGDPDFGKIITHVGKDLRSELIGLPKGTKVGIEYPRELCYGWKATKTCMIISTKKVAIPAATRMYWNEILDICKMRELVPVHLDDYQLVRDNLQLQVEADKKEGQINTAILNEKKLDKETVEKKVRNLKEERHRLQTEASFTHVIRREDRILDNIVREMPKVVIVSASNADYFVSDRETMLKRRVDFTDYAREEFNLKLDPSLLPHYIKKAPETFGKLVQKPEPTVKAIAERESVIRKMNAVSVGRIIKKKEEPRFIGTWDLEIPARGLFEVYVEHEMITLHNVVAISGSIEDTIGTSTFWGSIRLDPIVVGSEGLPESIRFEKTYDYSAEKAGGTPGTVRYDAVNRPDLKEGMMGGEFGIGTRKGEFLMTKFIPGENNLGRIKRNFQ